VRQKSEFVDDHSSAYVVGAACSGELRRDDGLSSAGSTPRPRAASTVDAAAVTAATATDSLLHRAPALSDQRRNHAFHHHHILLKSQQTCIKNITSSHGC